MAHAPGLCLGRLIKIAILLRKYLIELSHSHQREIATLNVINLIFMIIISMHARMYVVCRAGPGRVTVKLIN